MKNKRVRAVLLLIIVIQALSFIRLTDYYMCDFTPITTVEGKNGPYERSQSIADAEGYINMKSALAGEEQVVFWSREWTGEKPDAYRTNMPVSKMLMKCYIKGIGVWNAIQYLFWKNPRNDEK